MSKNKWDRLRWGRKEPNEIAFLLLVLVLLSVDRLQSSRKPYGNTELTPLFVVKTTCVYKARGEGL